MSRVPSSVRGDLNVTSHLARLALGAYQAILERAALRRRDRAMVCCTHEGKYIADQFFFKNGRKGDCARKLKKAPFWGGLNLEVTEGQGFGSVNA